MYAILAELLSNGSVWNSDAHIVDGPLTHWRSILGWKGRNLGISMWQRKTENLKALKAADQLAQLLSELSDLWWCAQKFALTPAFSLKYGTQFLTR